MKHRDHTERQSGSKLAGVTDVRQQVDESGGRSKEPTKGARLNHKAQGASQGHVVTYTTSQQIPQLRQWRHEPAAHEHSAEQPTATSDRVCASVTKCFDDEYEISPPSPTADRGCAPLTSCKAKVRQRLPL